MNSMNEKVLDIKAKIIEQTQILMESVDQAFIDGTAAHKVEENVLNQLLKMGHQCMHLLFGHYGLCDLGEFLDLSDGSRLKRLSEHHIKNYLSIFGLIEAERCVYGTREGQKIDYVPLDARLQLPKQKFSYLLQNWDQSLATEMPYLKVNETMMQILNLSIPVSSLERTNQNMNQYSEKYWDDQIEINPAEKAQYIVASSDCKGVVIRKSIEEKEEYRLNEGNQLKPASIESSSSKKRNGKKKMAVLGAVYTIESNVRSPDDVLDSLFRATDDPSPYENAPPRPKPQDKHVRASMHRDDADTLQPAREEIFNWLEQEYNERNPEGNNINILLMDGEEKLWSMGDALKVPSTPVKILDIIHASSYIWIGIQALYPNNTVVQNIPLVKTQVGHLLGGKASTVTRSLRWKATHMNLKGTRLEDINKACNYLDKNLDKMKYNEYLAAGYPIGSGVIEGACRNVVVDRMECSGMRWVMNGAKSMLNIRCIHLNGNWEHFINYYIEEEQKDLYPIKAANDDSFIESMVA